VPVQSLYFYIDGTSPKCFFEELPKDTLVVGHYTAEEYNDNAKMWSKHDGLNIFISVDVCTPSSASPLSLLTTRTIAYTIPGSIRQRPPCRLPEGLIIRPIYIQCRRIRGPQNLLHALVELWRLKLALGSTSARRHQVDARLGHWRDECYREHGQGKDPGYCEEGSGIEWKITGYQTRAGFPTCRSLSQVLPQDKCGWLV